MSEVTAIRRAELPCRCGCGQSYPLYSGLLRYGDDRLVAFRVGHFDEVAQTRHLWLLLGSGKWFDDDHRGCWLILDSWIDKEKLIARVTDAQVSPFRSNEIFDERFLARNEVLDRAGTLEWAIARRDDLIELHLETRRFLLGEDDT